MAIDMTCLLLGTKHDCNDVVIAFLACVDVCMLCEVQSGSHVLACAGVCDIRKGADSRGLQARTHEITSKVEFALLEAEPDILGRYLNIHK